LRRAKYGFAFRSRCRAEFLLHPRLVAPGITCFWQIGGRSEIDFSGQVQLDVRYIESQSFWLDIKILLKTVPAVLNGKGAY
jgi:lipopolysaccharide/colanic/teichoic acid biosynthesis glycosyltransferase